ncbi:MAG TPA: hypothetical protein VK029_00325, partial [Pseudogracilibacillus sp.]|nr:hypothetical protein [Pseudogracilibacillus sp.]
MEVFPGSWAWIIIIVTGILMFGSSWWIYTKSRVADAETFMVASRGVRWGLIAASVAATELWAGSLLGAAEGTYTWGLAGLWM